MNGHDRSQPPDAERRASELARHRESLVLDQAVSDADRATAGADQAVSDVDQAASERDDVDATRDQRSADRDQASADARHAGNASGEPVDGPAEEAYRVTRAARLASRVDRLKTHSSRQGATKARLGASRGRDRNAARRDDAAGRRDERMEALDAQLEALGSPAGEFARWRAQAAADRVAAAADRLQAASERTEAAIELGRLLAELHHAHLDDLTGAFGRTLGDHVLELEIDRSRRDDGRMVLAFIDVDGLKVINDRAGHAAGDLVLRTLVATMRTSLRSFDPIVRYGGDEFVCAISGVSLEEADLRFDTIRQSLYADTGASISVGMATLGDGETLGELTARADVALIGVKRSRPG